MPWREGLFVLRHGRVDYELFDTLVESKMPLRVRRLSELGHARARDGGQRQLVGRQLTRSWL